MCACINLFVRDVAIATSVVHTAGGLLNLTCVAFPEHACEDFRCDREFCIHEDLVCDEVNHCGDGSDELSSAVCTRKYNPHSVVHSSTYLHLRVSSPLSILTKVRDSCLTLVVSWNGIFSSPSLPDHLRSILLSSYRGFFLV